MATWWQRLKTSSGGWQSFSFVSSIFTRNNYKDLNNDVNEKSEGDQQGNGNQDEAELDQLDVGISRRRKYKLFQWDESEKTVSANDDPDSVVSDTLWRENNRNQLIESTKRRDLANQREIHSAGGSDTPTSSLQFDTHQTYQKELFQSDQSELTSSKICDELSQTNRIESSNIPSPQNYKCDKSDSSSDITPFNTPSSTVTATLVVSSADSVECYESTPNRRPRRSSYEKALTEMRDSYDRVFRDVMESLEDKPVVISNDIPSPVWATTVDLKEDTTYTISNGLEDNTSKKFGRQLSSVITDNIPGTINSIRQRSYSKLGNDSDEIVDIPLSDENKPAEWHDSFPASQKKKRKRSKKAWKKTKKALRVGFKWIRRSLITYGSSFNHGIPMTVAMYGGSRRDGRPKFYDYR